MNDRDATLLRTLSGHLPSLAKTQAAWFFANPYPRRRHDTDEFYYGFRPENWVPTSREKNIHFVKFVKPALASLIRDGYLTAEDGVKIPTIQPGEPFFWRAGDDPPDFSAVTQEFRVVIPPLQLRHDERREKTVTVYRATAKARGEFACRPPAKALSLYSAFPTRPAACRCHTMRQDVSDASLVRDYQIAELYLFHTSPLPGELDRRQSEGPNPSASYCHSYYSEYDWGLLRRNLGFEGGDFRGFPDDGVRIINWWTLPDSQVPTPDVIICGPEFFEPIALMFGPNLCPHLLEQFHRTCADMALSYGIFS